MSLARLLRLCTPGSSATDLGEEVRKIDHLVESTCGDGPSPEGCHLLLSLHLEQMLSKKTNKTLSALGDLGQYLYLRRVAFSFDPEGDKLGASSLKQRN